MKALTAITGSAALAIATPVIAEIHDADGEEAFITAFKWSLEIYPAETEQLSIGRLFKALGAYKSGEVEVEE